MQKDGPVRGVRESRKCTESRVQETVMSLMITSSLLLIIIGTIFSGLEIKTQSTEETRHVCKHVEITEDWVCPNQEITVKNKTYNSSDFEAMVKSYIRNIDDRFWVCNHSNPIALFIPSKYNGLMNNKVKFKWDSLIVINESHVRLIGLEILNKNQTVWTNESSLSVWNLELGVELSKSVGHCWQNLTNAKQWIMTDSISAPRNDKILRGLHGGRISKVGLLSETGNETSRNRRLTNWLMAGAKGHVTYWPDGLNSTHLILGVYKEKPVIPYEEIDWVTCKQHQTQGKYCDSEKACIHKLGMRPFSSNGAKFLIRKYGGLKPDSWASLFQHNMVKYCTDLTKAEYWYCYITGQSLYDQNLMDQYESEIFDKWKAYVRYMGIREERVLNETCETIKCFIDSHWIDNRGIHPLMLDSSHGVPESVANKSGLTDFIKSIPDQQYRMALALYVYKWDMLTRAEYKTRPSPVHMGLVDSVHGLWHNKFYIKFDFSHKLMGAYRHQFNKLRFFHPNFRKTIYTRNLVDVSYENRTHDYWKGGATLNMGFSGFKWNLYENSGLNNSASLIGAELQECDPDIFNNWTYKYIPPYARQGDEIRLFKGENSFCSWENYSIITEKIRDRCDKINCSIPWHAIFVSALPIVAKYENQVKKHCAIIGLENFHVKRKLTELVDDYIEGTSLGPNWHFMHNWISALDIVTDDVPIIVKIRKTLLNAGVIISLGAGTAVEIIKRTVIGYWKWIKLILIIMGCIVVIVLLISVSLKTAQLCGVLSSVCGVRRYARLRSRVPE